MNHLMNAAMDEGMKEIKKCASAIFYMPLEKQMFWHHINFDSQLSNMRYQATEHAT